MSYLQRLGVTSKNQLIKIMQDLNLIESPEQTPKYVSILDVYKISLKTNRNYIWKQSQEMKPSIIKKSKNGCAECLIHKMHVDHALPLPH